MARMTKLPSQEHDDRRSGERLSDDDFTPEYLAVLVLCGGTVRDADWALLPEALAARRPAANDDRPTGNDD